MPQSWIWRLSFGSCLSRNLSVDSDLFLAGPVFLLRDGELELDLVELVLELADLL